MLSAEDFQSNTAVATDMSRIAGIIQNGGYPEIQHKSLRARRFWLKSYLEGRLFTDFESLHAARGDYHSKLQALVPYLAGLSGNLLKYSNIGNRQNAWAQEEVRLYHFRDNRKHEVDLVLEQDNGEITGIEVKASATVGIKDFKGIRSLAELAPDQFKRGIVLYGGDRILPFTQEGLTLTAIPLGVILSRKPAN